MDWQSPASHPLHMAQALSKLIKRHFFTSPDAREKKKKKKERIKAPEGGILLSLYSGLLVNEDFFTMSPHFALFSILLLARKEKKHFPLRPTKLFLLYQKQLSSGEKCACRNTTIPRGEGGLHKSDWLAGSQDPLEVVMKSVTLASQLYVSIHNPSPKKLRVEPPTTPMAFAVCTRPALIYVAIPCHTLNLNRDLLSCIYKGGQKAPKKHTESSLRAS